ncbi:hypothetical protein [Winogradskyella luteola]|uniref:Aspartate kinase n=1 Tax=Winogradskyella luteola TaxID=2828330 RepID=A0A9X1JMP1_9FLAO|nr:hypothetical protein [Winogradskyella luteola]MBV7268496.1 hypothetical protein [Winogradskyella luteola]
MKTISSCVEDIIASKPFIEEALNEQIINFSALASNLQMPVSKMLRKDVKTGAIMMALRRYNQPINASTSIRLKHVFNNLGDITVRSGLSDFTFKNSKTLINCNTKVLDSVNLKDHIFYAFTRGIYESNIVISSSEKITVLNEFKDEEQIGLQENLSAITISLPKENSKVVGLYYHIFKRLAWEGVTLYEVISTTNEFTVLVEDNLVDKAFSVIKCLKQ